ncbi:heterokaryon incompatibility protein-domain-containing protein [Chaetomium tenue]|uniref:Heterokaryon incompatibility protein-domain-containing protein n=1 Tax=Chaetomium tenue TaxID=1854479 RepID=A0ACB7NXB9_9PEZI|nr:heterokaryon incompatibility protein-domain-containing protein [Chaetomium globosum]
MRLLTTAPTAIPHLRDFIGSHIPPYAILSHTWGDDEVTLQQLAAADLFALQGRARFDKVQKACALARTRDALEYAWVDTCCIDKTSSAELSEAINSMFAWYRDAEVCYVFLSDLEPGQRSDLERDLPGCRWFTRGWTLQELVAPRKVLFFDREWNYRGSKEELAWQISKITNIPVMVLNHQAELGDFAVARRMSWAANRETTRLEDMAYCLLGIFDVNLSLIYGEGVKSFARLQAAILQTTPDLSIFAWVDKSDTCSEYAGILATCPAQFADCWGMEAPVDNSAYANFTMTTRGIQTEASLVPVTCRGGTPAIVALDTRCRMRGLGVGVHVRKIGASLYVRSRPHTLFRGGVDEDDFYELSSLVELLTLATKLPVRLTIPRGIDLVAKNRCSAFRLGWGPFVGREVQRMPRSHFDTEDGVFFSCDPRTEGWCVYVINGTLPGGSIPGLVSEGVYLKLFFACFQWNSGLAIVVLTSLNSVDAGTGRLLESFLVSQLDQTRFEACQWAKNLVTGIFGDSLVIWDAYGLSPGR